MRYLRGLGCVIFQNRVIVVNMRSSSGSSGGGGGSSSSSSSSSSNQVYCPYRALWAMEDSTVHEYNLWLNS